jgi:hypothetical protein
VRRSRASTRRALLTLHRVPWRQRDAQIDEGVELAAKGEEVERFELAGGLPQYRADGDASSDRVERATETDERVQEPREAGKPPGASWPSVVGSTAMKRFDQRYSIERRFMKSRIPGKDSPGKPTIAIGWIQSFPTRGSKPPTRSCAPIRERGRRAASPGWSGGAGRLRIAWTH